MNLTMMRFRTPVRWAPFLAVLLWLTGAASVASAQPWGGVNGFSVSQVRHAQQGQFQQVRDTVGF